MKKLIAAVFASVLATSSFAQKVVMLRDNGPLRIEKNGVLEWAMEVPTGTEFEITNTSTIRKNLKTNAGVEKDIEFYAVKYQDKNYFVRESESETIEAATQVAVVKANATIFENEKPSSFRNAFLEPGTLVVTDVETIGEYKPGKLGFTKVVFWDSSAWSKKTRYVQTKKLSANSDDIRAARFVDRASLTKDEGMKKEFISKALESAKSEEIKAYVQASYNKIFGIKETPESTPIEAWVTVYSADGDNVNVRDYPGTDGKIVGKCATGARGVITEASAIQSTIDGVTSPWYYISTPGDSPVEGWIFGGFVVFETDQASISN